MAKMVRARKYFTIFTTLAYFVTFAIFNILLKVEMAKRTLMAETFDIFVVLAFRQFFHRQLSIILTMVKMAKKAKTKMKKMA